MVGPARPGLPVLSPHRTLVNLHQGEIVSSNAQEDGRHEKIDGIEKIHGGNATCFNYFDLNWELYITVDENLLRSGDPEKIISNPKKILDKLDWKTETSFEKLIEKCIKYQMQH